MNRFEIITTTDDHKQSKLSKVNKDSISTVLRLIGSDEPLQSEILYFMHVLICDNTQGTVSLNNKLEEWTRFIEKHPWSSYTNKEDERLNYSLNKMAYTCSNCDVLTLPLSFQQERFYGDLQKLFEMRHAQAFRTLAGLLRKSNARSQVFLEFIVNPDENLFMRWTNPEQSITKSWKMMARKWTKEKNRVKELETELKRSRKRIMELERE